MEPEAFVQLTLVRHGETEANKEKIVQGQRNTALSDHGRWQSRIVGRRLAREAFSHIYSSDLARALETAEIIAAELENEAEVMVDRRLRERAFGTLEGQPLSSLVQAASSAGVSVREFTPPGGESLPAVGSRVAAFLSDLLSRVVSAGDKPCLPVRDGTILSSHLKSSSAAPPPPLPHYHVLVVSHGGAMHCLLEQLRAAHGCLPHRSSSTPNTGVTSLLLTVRDRHCHSVHTLTAHDATHLSLPHSPPLTPSHSTPHSIPDSTSHTSPLSS